VADINETLTVNQALDNLSKLLGHDVQIKGILHFDHEDIAIYHHPGSERKLAYESSIWLTTGSGSLGFDEKACMKFNGKMVTVAGFLIVPEQTSYGCGHMGLWPAELLTRTMTLA
jgi:hypothetical protein